MATFEMQETFVHVSELGTEDRQLSNIHKQKLVFRHAIVFVKIRVIYQ